MLPWKEVKVLRRLLPNEKILITGANSYLVQASKMGGQCPINIPDTVDMKDALWKEKDFSQYDVVFHGWDSSY